MFEIPIVIDQDRNNPIYLQVYEAIKLEIQAGRMTPGTKLPSKRKLAQHLQISQTTVETAYEQLMAEGYVDSFPRKGIFVKELNSDLFSVTNKIPFRENDTVQPQKEKVQYDFSHGGIALEAFPYSIWRKLSVQSLYEEESSLFLNGERNGEAGLREELASYLYQSRGVICTPNQIVLGAGTQFLIGLLTMMIGKDAIYSMEEPGFHRTRQVFKDQGVKLIPILLDQDGMDIKKLSESKAKVTYVTPSHQFPIGMVMPIKRRMELIHWAVENNGFIIEDDYDGEFRYKGKPIPSLQGLDSNGKVIYLGTFSKSLIPSIRISYMVLPVSLLEVYHRHFTIYKQTVSRIHQHTLWHFMKNGHWERHLNRMRTVYRKKQEVLVLMIKKLLGKRVSMIGEEAGLHVLLRVNNQMTETELIERAAKFGVKVYPTSIYYEEQKAEKETVILLGFGGLSEAEIQEGIRLLAKAWFDD